MIALAAITPAAAAPSPTHYLAAAVAGIMSGSQVVVAGTPVASGFWGTDYITVSHALGVGRNYAVVHNGEPPVPAVPVMACSSAAHGIDILILRVASHKNLEVIEWGDPATLRRGDELIVMVRKEIHPTPTRLRFLHVNLLEWSRTSSREWPRAWHNVMVADGFAKPGFSGSPVVKEGKVYGLLKGAVRLPGQTAWYPTAETSTRVKHCLQEQSYDQLIPKQLEPDLVPQR